LHVDLDLDLAISSITLHDLLAVPTLSGPIIMDLLWLIVVTSCNLDFLVHAIHLTNTCTA